MKKLEQKQIPQFAALCVLTAGVAGYGVMHLVTPGTASAGTRPAAPAALPAKPGDSRPSDAKPSDAKPSDAKPSDAKPSDAKPSDAKLGAVKPGDTAALPAADSGDAPPPSPAMRDPFVVGIADSSALPAALAAAVKAPALPGLAGKLPPTGKQVASLGPMPVSMPGVPTLPPGGLSGFPPRPSAAPGQAGVLPTGPAAPALPPAPPAPPTWTVTGVLQGADGKVAILRSGEARRIVRSGDFVDSTYRVTGVSRTAVVLRHGTLVYQLSLGAAALGAAKPSALPAALMQPIPASARPARIQPARPQPLSPPAMSSLSGPALSKNHLPPAHAPLAHLVRLGPGPALAAATLSVPKMVSVPRPAPVQPAKPSPTKVARAIRLGLRLLDGTVLDKN